MCNCWHCQDQCECWVHDCPSCAARCPEVIDEELDELGARINQGLETLETIRISILKIIDEVVADFDEGWDALEKLAPELPLFMVGDVEPFVGRWGLDSTRVLVWTGDRANPERSLIITPRCARWLKCERCHTDPLHG
jgi:hypothetical protein